MLSILPLRVKLLLGKVNPFKMKSQHCALNEQTREILASFVTKKQISPSNSIYRFKMNDDKKVLGIQIGESVTFSTSATSTQEAYPITRIDDPAFIDIIVSDVIHSGSFLNQLKEKDAVSVRAPDSRKFVYDGFGKIRIFGKDGVTAIQKKVDYLGVIAQDFHVSTILSLIEGISTNGDTTHLSVFIVNKNIEDSLFIDELTWFAEEKRIVLTVLTEQVPEGVPILKGKLRQQHLADFMPPVGNNTHILVAGNQEFQDTCNGHLQKLGYSESMVTLR